MVALKLEPEGAPESWTASGSTEQIRRWALYDRDPLDAWSNGPVTLLGDAAHPMLPHRGQSASQAFEDPVVLSHCLAQAGDDTKR